MWYNILAVLRGISPGEVVGSLEGIPEAERETLKLRLLAIAAVVAGLYMRQREILRQPETFFFVLGLAIVYLAYTLALQSLIIPRIKTPYIVYGMILVDAAALLIAMHLAGGLQSNIFILFPVFVIFYAIHSDYSSSFFAATVISFALAGYAFFAEPRDFSAGKIVALQIPSFFLLAYFSGFLARRTTREREKREALQELIRIESGTKGLREIVQVMERGLELYEEWHRSYAHRTPEKEAVEKLRFSLSIDAQYALAHYAFGRIYAESGQLTRATEAFRKAIALGPNLPEAYGGLCEALMRQGRFEEALEPAVRYAEAAQQDWVAHQHLAVIYDELGMDEESRAAQDKAMAVSGSEDREALEVFFSRLRQEPGRP